jgi:hypothetical protein
MPKCTRKRYPNKLTQLPNQIQNGGYTSVFFMVIPYQRVDLSLLRDFFDVPLRAL